VSLGPAPTSLQAPCVSYPTWPAHVASICRARRLQCVLAYECNACSFARRAKVGVDLGLTVGSGAAATCFALCSWEGSPYHLNAFKLMALHIWLSSEGARLPASGLGGPRAFWGIGFEGAGLTPFSGIALRMASKMASESLVTSWVPWTVLSSNRRRNLRNAVPVHHSQ
jgi:hypothetical protein